MASTTKTVTGFAVTGIRTNEDSTLVLIATVTYSDTTIDVIELPIVRLTP